MGRTTLLIFGFCSLAFSQINVNKLVWTTCGSCPQPAEVVAAGAAVTVGVAGRGQSEQQNMAYHMAATLLPPANSYTIAFQYSLSTWDSYDAPGTPNPPFNGGFGVPGASRSEEHTSELQSPCNL